MRQTITLPMSALSLNKSYRINQFITSICKTLEKKLQTNHAIEQTLTKKIQYHEDHNQSLEFKMKNNEANNHENDIKACEDRIQKIKHTSATIFNAFRFLSYLDFVRRISQTDHSWFGDVYYCNTTTKRTNRAHHHQMAANVQIEIKNQELEITINTTNDTTKSHPDFAQRLYNSFCALSDKTKIESADHARPRCPNPLAIDDNSDAELDDDKSNARRLTQTQQGSFSHLRKLGSFIFSSSATQTSTTPDDSRNLTDPKGSFKMLP